MPILKDLNGNPFFGSFDVIAGQTLTDPRVSAATLNSLAGTVLMDVQGHATALFDLRSAAANLTVVFEGTVNGSDYYSLPGMDVATEQQLTAVVSTTTIARLFAVDCTGFRRVRARISAYTSGTITIASRASRAEQFIYAKPMPSTLWVSATAAAASGVTLTIPAAGVGLFHYITSLHIVRAATAALAGSTNLNITTTNWPGSASWMVGNAIGAGEQRLDLDFQPANPMKSSAANTATTIVCPAPGAAVIWRVNCSYYVGA